MSDFIATNSIYLFVFVCIGVFGYILEFNNLKWIHFIDLIISIPSLFGLCALAFDKKIFNKTFWKAYFVGFLIWHIIINLILDQNNLINGLTAEIIFVPLFIALFFYAYKINW